jgi:hypothetical protein
MTMAVSKALFFVVLVFVGEMTLTSRAQMTKPAPPTPIDEKKVELGGMPWNPQWDAIIERALPPEILSSQVPRDVLRFCPRFHEMDETDKRIFWAYFFQALAGAEAGLNPNASVRHTEQEVLERDGVTGTVIRSEGLLQLAYADQKRYGCDFNWQVDHALKTDDPPAQEQSRMRGEDSGQPDHRSTQALVGHVRILVDIAGGDSELPCIFQADDESPNCMWCNH